MGAKPLICIVYIGFQNRTTWKNQTWENQVRAFGWMVVLICILSTYIAFPYVRAFQKRSQLYSIDSLSELTLFEAC